MKGKTTYEHGAKRRNNPTGEMATTSHPERRAPARHKTDVKEKDRNRIPTLDWNRQRETKTVLAPLLSTVEKIDPAAWIETLRRQPEQGDMFGSFDRYEIPNGPSGSGTSTAATGRTGNSRRGDGTSHTTGFRAVLVHGERMASRAAASRRSTVSP